MDSTPEPLKDLNGLEYALEHHRKGGKERVGSLGTGSVTVQFRN